MVESEQVALLERQAKTIRCLSIEMIGNAGSGHPGGALSAAEIMSVLYFNILRVDPENPDWEDRDRFVLSKGHGCPALYAVLADQGFFPREELWTLRKLGSRLQGHPQLGLPGLEISSGSLGQGLSIAAGFALADRMDNVDAHVYCLMGDGETNEGQVWEAAATAAHYELANLCAIIDFNRLQIDGWCCDVKTQGEYRAKWENFGWHAVEADGHDFDSLAKAFEETGAVKDRPQIVIAHTVKGKGISFIENQVNWHGIAPKKEELEKALAELDEAEKALDAE